MICLVTDRRRLSVGSGDAQVGSGFSRTDLTPLITFVAAAAEAGVDLIQIRERDLDARELMRLVRRCVEAATGTGANIIVNDRADVACAAGAHGVHLRADSYSAAAARSLCPPPAIVGRSVHSAAEAAEVSHAGGLDYLILGTLFRTVSKDASQPLTSIEEFATACRQSAAPVLAIGGITLERAALVAKAGGAGVAGIGLFLPPDGESPRRHLAAVVASLRRVFDTCRAVP